MIPRLVIEIIKKFICSKAHAMEVKMISSLICIHAVVVVVAAAFPMLPI
jgi:hypothetical protein